MSSNTESQYGNSELPLHTCRIDRTLKDWPQRGRRGREIQEVPYIVLEAVAQSHWEQFWQFFGMLRHFRTPYFCFLFPSGFRMVYRCRHLLTWFANFPGHGWKPWCISRDAGRSKAELLGPAARATVTKGHRQAS